jgi:hypothetical protein
MSLISGSLSPRHGTSSRCGWRNGLQIWKATANILNKQSRTADKGWSSSFGLGEVLTTPHRKNLNMLRIIHRGLGTGLILWYDLTGTGGGLLWMRWWTFGFHKMRGISSAAKDLLASQEAFSAPWSYEIQSEVAYTWNTKIQNVSNIQYLILISVFAVPYMANRMTSVTVRCPSQYTHRARSPDITSCTTAASTHFVL